MVQEGAKADRFMRLREVMERTGMRRGLIYGAMERGEFPASVKIGERATAWVEREIEAWIEERIRASRGGS